MERELLTRVIIALDNYSFTIKEYLKDGGQALIKRAMNYLIEVGVKEEVSYNCLRAILKARCQYMMETSVDWIESPVGDASKISFNMKGNVVRGFCRIEPKRVSVSLWWNKREVVKESFIYDLSPRIYTIYPVVGSPANTEGKLCAKRLFLKLYYEMLYQ